MNSLQMRTFKLFPKTMKNPQRVQQGSAVVTLVGCCLAGCLGGGSMEQLALETGRLFHF